MCSNDEDDGGNNDNDDDANGTIIWHCGNKYINESNSVLETMLGTVTGYNELAMNAQRFQL